MELLPELRQQLLTFQRLDITEHLIYKHLAGIFRSPEKSRVLEKIAQEELRHYQYWKKYTGQDVKPDKLAICKYCLLRSVFGFAFSIKLMELGEETTQSIYAELRSAIPEIDIWIQEDKAHEQALIDMLDEDRLLYDGSVILGLNDGLVGLTGGLAVLTLALQNSRLIALSGLMTGIAAAMSMAVSEYLFTRLKNTRKHPLPAAIYTGIAYLFSVTLLILPYLILDNYYLALTLALGTAVLIIAVYNYYISIAKDEPFRERFFEMTGLSLGLAGVMVPVGYLIRIFLGLEP